MRLPYSKFLQPEKSSDAVLEMHDQVAFIQFAEIDLRAVSLRATQMPACMGGESSKQFGSRQDDKIGCGETKSTRECSFDKIDAELFGRFAAHARRHLR